MAGQLCLFAVFRNAGSRPSRQLTADLANDFRLLAMRGHGLSRCHSLDGDYSTFRIGVNSMKKLLITGGSGDLGRVLSRKAIQAGYDVTAAYLSRPERIKWGKAVQLDLTN